MGNNYLISVVLSIATNRMKCIEVLSGLPNRSPHTIHMWHNGFLLVFLDRSESEVNIMGDIILLATRLWNNIHFTHFHIHIFFVCF